MVSRAANVTRRADHPAGLQNDLLYVVRKNGEPGVSPEFNLSISNEDETHLSKAIRTICFMVDSGNNILYRNRVYPGENFFIISNYSSFINYSASVNVGTIDFYNLLYPDSFRIIIPEGTPEGPLYVTINDEVTRLEISEHFMYTPISDIEFRSIKPSSFDETVWGNGSTHDTFDPDGYFRLMVEVSATENFETLETTVYSDDLTLMSFTGLSAGAKFIRMKYVYKPGHPATVIKESQYSETYCFVVKDNNWPTTEQSVIVPTPITPGAVNYFESLSVSDDGQYLAIGDPWQSITEGSGFERGCVFLYKRNGFSWTLQQTFTPPGVPGSNRFGFSVSLNQDGSELVIGQIGYGLVEPDIYYTKRTGTAWSALESLAPIIKGVYGHNLHGVSVALTTGIDVYTNEIKSFLAFECWRHVVGEVGYVEPYICIFEQDLTLISGHAWVPSDGTPFNYKKYVTGSGASLQWSGTNTLVYGRYDFFNTVHSNTEPYKNAGGVIVRYRVPDGVGFSNHCQHIGIDLPEDIWTETAGTSVSISGDGKYIVVSNPSWEQWKGSFSLFRLTSHQDKINPEEWVLDLNYITTNQIQELYSASLPLTVTPDFGYWQRTINLNHDGSVITCTASNYDYLDSNRVFTGGVFVYTHDLITENVYQQTVLSSTINASGDGFGYIADMARNTGALVVVATGHDDSVEGDFFTFV